MWLFVLSGMIDAARRIRSGVYWEVRFGGDYSPRKLQRQHNEGARRDAFAARESDADGTSSLRCPAMPGHTLSPPHLAPLRQVFSLPSMAQLAVLVLPAPVNYSSLVRPAD